MTGFLEWFRNGGPIMYPILITGLVGLAVFMGGST